MNVTVGLNIKSYLILMAFGRAQSPEQLWVPGSKSGLPRPSVTRSLLTDTRAFDYSPSNPIRDLENSVVEIEYSTYCSITVAKDNNRTITCACCGGRSAPCHSIPCSYCVWTRRFLAVAIL